MEKGLIRGITLSVHAGMPNVLAIFHVRLAYVEVRPAYSVSMGFVSLGHALGLWAFWAIISKIFLGLVQGPLEGLGLV